MEIAHNKRMQADPAKAVTLRKNFRFHFLVRTLIEPRQETIFGTFGLSVEKTPHGGGAFGREV